MFCGLDGHSEGPPAELKELVQDIGKLQMGQTASSGCNPELESYKLGLEFTRDNIRLTSDACQSRLSAQALCLRALRECEGLHRADTATGSGSMGGFKIFEITSGSQTCIAQGDVTQKRRFGSDGLKRKVFEIAGQFFHKIINSPEIQKKCCGDDSACAEHFARTKLVIRKGGSPHEVGGSYTPSIFGMGHAVKFSEAALANRFNEEAVEVGILHELGHACQFSRHVKNLSKYISLMQGDFCISSATTKDDFLARLGDETTNCILEAQNKDPKVLKCGGSWAMEAFADVIFMSEWKTVGHFAPSCFMESRHLTGFFHGPVNLDCLINRPEIYSNLCSITEGAQ